MNGLGRIHFPFDVGRWSALGLAAAALLLLGRHTIAQDDPRDVESLRRRDVNHESRLETRDIDRERRAADGAVDNRRIDPRIIERRNRLYQDLKQDFHSFDKDNFDTDPGVRRLRLAPPVGIVESNETLDNVRRLVDRFAQEADALQLALNQNVDYIRGVRGVLPDAIQFSANAQVLRDRCQREGRLAALCGDYEAFDRDWQAISYRLHQIPEMSRTAELKRVDVMDNLDRQLSGVLKIQPQFDQHDLLHHISALTDQLQRLAEDIDVEFVDAEQRRILGGQARRVESEAQMVCDTIDAGNDPSSVVGEFKEYQALWYPLARQIRQVDTNRALERTVMRINRSNRELNQLLRNPQQADPSNLSYIVEGLKHDIDEYFTRAPLKLVMELPESRSALATAGAFYGNCEQFLQDAAAENASASDLAESFHNVADSWRAFEHVFRPMASEPARRVLNHIEEGINAVADSLQISDQQFDRRRIRELGFALLAAADNINRDAQIWIDRDQNSPEAAADETANFLKHCQRFSDAINSTTGVDQLRQGIMELYEHYKRVYQFISQCQGRERANLGENANRAKNALVDLRTLLEI
jgi:cold shock CspA family protein